MKKTLAAICVVALAMPAFAQDFIPPEGFGPQPKPPVATPRSTNPFVLPETFTSKPTTPPTKTLVPFTAENGRIIIAGRINDAITVDFLLDSGSSVISIPREVFAALWRYRSIIPSDMLGMENFVMADGRSRREETFIIQSLRVGDVTVHNVEASTGGPEALLGQSFLMQFKSWQIDNSQQVINLSDQ